MELEFQASSQSVEEMGFAIIDRANRVRSQGNEEMAEELRIIGRVFIERARIYSPEEEEDSVEFEDSLLGSQRME